MSTVTEQVEIDFLLLADRVEVLNGKIYMMGGGWNRRYIADITAPVDISMVIGVLVPWNLTNQPHSVLISLEDEDGTALSPQPTVTLNVGRPPDATQGQTFRATARLTARWTLPRLGAYSVVIMLNGVEAKRTVFYAIERKGQATPG